MAAGLFWELRCELIEALRRFEQGEGPPPERAVVGIITPYRSQRDLIRETLARLLGPEVAKEVRVETVDGFQVCCSCRVGVGWGWGWLGIVGIGGR